MGRRWAPPYPLAPRASCPQERAPPAPPQSSIRIRIWFQKPASQIRRPYGRPPLPPRCPPLRFSPLLSNGGRTPNHRPLLLLLPPRPHRRRLPHLLTLPSRLPAAPRPPRIDRGDSCHLGSLLPSLPPILGLARLSVPRGGFLSAPGKRNRVSPRAADSTRHLSVHDCNL
uniref:Uncharacterized protein n=1 Tax=Oryza meridionalis TaxID=40149 RepID=A0A0E0CH90_9ORYZ